MTASLRSPQWATHEAAGDWAQQACVTTASLRSHSELHTRLQGAEPSKPGQASPLPHTLSCHSLLLAVTVSVTHCWVCPPWDIGSISCSETIKFFQPQSVFNKANQATKLRFEIGLYFCFLHCTRERWKTPNCASKLSFSPRIDYRIRGFPELNHWWFSG